MTSESEWTSDFDDFIGGNRDAPLDYDDDDDEPKSKTSSTSLSDFLAKSASRDLTGVTTRLFSLGQDLIVNDYVGNMGFEEVTDWEYYYQNEEDIEDRKVVNPNPFDSSTPKRTRTNSGSVIRIFRGNFVGNLGNGLRSKGLDNRILIKEFTGVFAQQLAKNEQQAVAKLQSALVESKYDNAKEGDWVQAAASRSVLGKMDSDNVSKLLQELTKAPHVGILGEVNLAELEDEEGFPNDFYRALGVPPPQTGAIWIVYDYQGLNTIQSYTSMPPQKRRSKLPLKKSFFGGYQEPPKLPKFEERTKYVVKGITAQSLLALANLHEAGLVHRSIGRSSLVLTGPSQDKTEASSIYATRPQALTVKLSDFGFAGPMQESAADPEFVARARTFGISLREGDTSLVATNFAMAEDLHALGFVMLGLLLVALADLPTANSPMPATDEDTLQKLLSEIFDKNFGAFREYVEEEEAWTKLVQVLDEKNGAGWEVLETLFLARETIAKNQNSLEIVTARGLLKNRFFAE